MRLIGDLAIAAFFGADNKKERAQLREQYDGKIRSFIAGSKGGNGAGARQELRSCVALAFGGAKPIHTFHWEIEFPEVFSRGNPGFDMFVGNPPFGGKNSISALGGDSYIPYLQEIHEESHGASDLVAHFFRRAFGLLRMTGTLGLIATNTISQGDTRHTGLRCICTHGGEIFEARKRYKWPAGAAVIVSVIHIIKGAYSGVCLLDEEPVECISAFLFHGAGDEDPSPLKENEGKSFQGCILLGMGFTFDDSNPEATPISEMESLIAKDPRNKERIFPYIGGEELNDSPTQAFRRYAMDFNDLSEAEARKWPDLMAIVESKVKPVRITVRRQVRAKHWWQYAERAPALRRATHRLERALAIARHTEHCSFVFLPRNMIYSEALVVFALELDSAFAILQSRVHETWARFFGSSLGATLRYSPSDCFETFPFPAAWKDNKRVEDIGRNYYELRADLMVRNNEGLTKTYNRFHDPDKRDPDILKLRELHDAMDRAVLNAYGWADLKPTCDFFLDYEEEESEDGASRKRKKPWRYRWPDDFRDDVLARLLALNQERAAQERLAGSAESPKLRRARRRSEHDRDRTSEPIFK